MRNSHLLTKFLTDIDFIAPNIKMFQFMKNLLIEDKTILFNSKEVDDIFEIVDLKAQSTKISIFIKNKKEKNEPLIKIEILSSLNVEIEGVYDNELFVEKLTLEEMLKEKIEANIDRGNDKNNYLKDAIDITFLIKRLNGIPQKVFDQVCKNYSKKNIINSLIDNCKLLTDEKFYNDVIRNNRCNKDIKNIFPALIKKELKKLLTKEEFKEFSIDLKF